MRKVTHRLLDLSSKLDEATGKKDLDLARHGHRVPRGEALGQVSERELLGAAKSKARIRVRLKTVRAERSHRLEG